MIKKATTKRERKYGSVEKNVKTFKEKKPKGKKPVEKKKEEVQVMVERAYIMKFSSREEAMEYILKKHEQADKDLRARAIYEFI